MKPEEEWEFVLKMAKLYSRAGCDVLALDLGMSILCVPIIHC